MVFAFCIYLRRFANFVAGFLGVWRLMGDTGMSSAPLLTSLIINAAGLAAASITIASLGFAGAAVMIWLVAETHEP